MGGDVRHKEPVTKPGIKTKFIQQKLLQMNNGLRFQIPRAQFCTDCRFYSQLYKIRAFKLRLVTGGLYAFSK